MSAPLGIFSSSASSSLFLQPRSERFQNRDLHETWNAAHKPTDLIKPANQHIRELLQWIEIGRNMMKMMKHVRYSSHLFAVSGCGLVVWAMEPFLKKPPSQCVTRWTSGVKWSVDEFDEWSWVIRLLSSLLNGSTWVHLDAESQVGGHSNERTQCVWLVATLARSWALRAAKMCHQTDS
jgi:hypothetical protein